jgi:hypothetical protein
MYVYAKGRPVTLCLPLSRLPTTKAKRGNGPRDLQANELCEIMIQNHRYLARTLLATA